MQPRLTLDAREWTKAARELQETSSRTCVDFINGQALRVSIEAVRQTERANRAEIEHVLGATGQNIKISQISRGKNKGQMRLKKGGYNTKEDSLAARILWKRYKEKGSWGVRGENMPDIISNFIKARVRSAAFIASGYVAARQKLFGLVKKKPAKIGGAVAGARIYGKPKGDAKPAVFSLRSKMEAWLINTALLTESKAGSKGNPMPVAIKGMQKALNVTARDMIDELARRLNPDFKKVSAK